MIVDAWYMVSEYKLNLGPADTLEALVHSVHEGSGVKSNEKKERILALREKNDESEFYRELIRRKKVLALNVQYRLQEPFMDAMKGKQACDGRPAILAERINQQQRLMYYFINFNGPDTIIEITEPWYEYIIANQENLKG